MQVDSQAQSLDEAGAQDRVGQRFARHSVQSSLEKTVLLSEARTPMGEVTDRGFVEFTPTTQKF